MLRTPPTMAPSKPGKNFTAEEVQYMLDNLEAFDEDEKEEILKNLSGLEESENLESARDDLVAFCCAMQEDYKVGKHHRILADLLMDIEAGITENADGTYVGLDRVAVNIPPRHGKSQMGTIYYSAWYLGRNPTHKVMLVSHTSDLAVDFGRKVRNLINTPLYRSIFPNVQLAKDSKSAGRWNTNHGGEFYATGIGSNIAGRGADLLLIDDPHSEQDVLAGNFSVFAKAYDWYAYGARTRLMPGGRVVIIQTRWHQDDMTGRVVKDMAMNDGADQFHVVEFPAIFEIETVTYTNAAGEEVSKEEIWKDKHTAVVEKPLWPGFFSLAALHRTKASMPLFQWNSQYQQNPTAEEAAIIKRDDWNIWMEEEPPECFYVIMTVDAAAEKHNRADFSAITVWGVFVNTDEDENHVILLDAVRERVEFHELKALALKHYNLRQPDSFIVEKKSSGVPLYQELRRMGIPVQEYTPVRGSGDKIARLNGVADMVNSRKCWVPQTRWAESLVDEVASFPYGSNDDLVDCTSMALKRFRDGGFVRLPSDEKEPEKQFKAKRRSYY